ncbi:MAG TPA: ABC transporter substrate-binding protein [Streptosporangiaceae bacterium]|nr:ABC transporter substrate-binding protein [Streptosporangiaceae bacterium]
MRRLVVVIGAAVVLASSLSACGSTSSPSVSASAVSCTKPGINKLLYKSGVLTVATDTPAYTPWFENNMPSNGKGYESAVAYAVAAQLGFSHAQVTWVHEPFNSVYAPGPKAFDFDINEVSYTAQRGQAVTFSNSYYPVQQAIVALKGTPIVTKHSPAQLKGYLYGDQIGTTGLAYINTKIQPTKTPKVFNTLALAASALEDHRIDALVTDTPTAQYMATAQLKKAVLVAQFPTVGEHYGLVLAKGNKLVTCLNKAIKTLTSDGKLAALQKQYLGIYLHFPTIKP